MGRKPFDFGYGAATYTNNKVYPDHGIPYWPEQSIILDNFIVSILIASF